MSKETTKTIGIVGSSGFLGQNLLGKLKKKGVQTKSFDRNLPKKLKSDKSFIGDASVEIPGDFLDGVDVVINLVGQFPPPLKDQIIGNTLVIGNLCEAMVKSGINKLVHISTAEVYGYPKENKPFTEESSPIPVTTYGLSKKIGEELVEFYCKNFGISAIILRPANTYGPGSDHGVVYNFLKSIKETGGVKIHGDGTQKRDFLFVGDLVDAIYKSISYPKNEVFNITTSESYDLNTLVGIMQDVLGKKISLAYEGEVQGAKVVSAENSKARRLLGWQPKVSLKEGVARTFREMQ